MKFAKNVTEVVGATSSEDFLANLFTYLLVWGTDRSLAGVRRGRWRWTSGCGRGRNQTFDAASHKLLIVETPMCRPRPRQVRSRDSANINTSIIISIQVKVNDVVYHAGVLISLCLPRTCRWINHWLLCTDFGGWEGNRGHHIRLTITFPAAECHRPDYIAWWRTQLRQPLNNVNTVLLQL